MRKITKLCFSDLPFNVCKFVFGKLIEFSFHLFKILLLLFIPKEVFLICPHLLRKIMFDFSINADKEPNSKRCIKAPSFNPRSNGNVRHLSRMSNN